MKTAFKAFMIILLIQVSAIFVACSTEEELAKKKAETYYLNEDFVLADRKEVITYDSDRRVPTKIRTWVIYRIVGNSSDSIEVAEILSKAEGTASDFNITTDLWFNKPVGSMLHFEYIRKNRFFKTTKEKLGLTTTTVSMPYSGITTVTAIPVPSIAPAVDKDLIELERQKASIEREIESIKRIQK